MSLQKASHPATEEVLEDLDVRTTNLPEFGENRRPCQI